MEPMYSQEAKKLNEEYKRQCIQNDLQADKDLFDGFHSLIEKDKEDYG